MSERSAERELVFCHECENEWYRDEHGLECPDCHSAFCEVIDPNNDPREGESPGASTADLRGHNPWQDVPDPDEDDISQYQPPGSFRNAPPFSTQYPHSQQQDRHPGAFDPNPIFQGFAQMLGNLGGPQHPGQERNNMFPPPGEPGNRNNGGTGQPQVRIINRSGPGFTFTATTRTGTFGSGEPMDLGQMLQGLLGGIAGPGGAANNPFHEMLTGILGMHGAPGDYASNQASFDQIVTQLMNEHQSGNAPGPASPEAIARLPQRTADATLFKGADKAECNICMDDVDAAAKTTVTVLPCSHWFHPDCIAMWLREHDTCPICREGIMPKNPEPQNSDAPRAPGQQPLHNEDPIYNIARRHSAGADASLDVPDSPSAARRRPRNTAAAANINNNDQPRDPRGSAQQPGGSGPGSGGFFARFTRNQQNR